MKNYYFLAEIRYSLDFNPSPVQRVYVFFIPRSIPHPLRQQQTKVLYEFHRIQVSYKVELWQVELLIFNMEALPNNLLANSVFDDTEAA